MSNDMITKIDARRLAVAYSAYIEANTDLSARVWGKMLLKAQSETGISLITEQTILNSIEAAGGEL